MTDENQGISEDRLSTAATTQAEPANGTPVATAEPIKGCAALAGVFFSPREAFQRIVERPWWFALIPIAIVTILSFAGSIVFVNKVDMAQLVRDQLKQSRFASQMSESQIEEAADKAAQRPKWIQPAIGVVAVAVVVVILAAVFWLVLLAFGHDITFGRSFQATAWAFLPGVITSAIFLILLLVKDANAIDLKNPIATNPAALFSREDIAKPLYALLQSFDLFKIWIIALLGFGLGAAARCRVRTAILSVVVLYAVWVVLLMGLAAIF